MQAVSTQRAIDDYVVTASEADRREASLLPLNTRFELGDRITGVQKAFLDEHGFILFSKVASPEEVKTILEEMERVDEEHRAEGRTAVRGVPLFMGTGPDGNDWLQRIPFSSLFSPFLSKFVRDTRFDPVRGLIGPTTRVGDEEKDGVVFNRYLNMPGSIRPGLGWHTDGLRSVFYGRLPGPMLNVGLHFDRITEADGGLRIIPGSHKQGLFATAFRKPYFIWHRPDPAEIAIETEPGDLTVHDGRTWHRVAASPNVGLASLRRSMYVPYLTDAYSPKDEDSKPLLYHRLFDQVLKLKRKLG